jgi:hypothetical protein
LLPETDCLLNQIKPTHSSRETTFGFQSWLTSGLPLSFELALISLALFFLRDTFTASAASPPVDTEPATINPIVVKQNGHIIHLSGGEAAIVKPPLYC